MDCKDVAIQIEHVSKEYRLGVYNYATFKDELQAWWARLRGKKDPTLRIGAKEKHIDGDILCAVSDVSFTVRKGESLGIIGANGAGKSTLLKLICQITAPTRGTIGINGRISSMLEVGVGFMPELTGRENIFLSGAVLGMSRREVASKLDAIAEFSECAELLDTPLKRYSSGMRVKLGFSIAAHLDNEIMIMDEVLAVGDMRFQKKCLDCMSHAATQEGKTVLYVSHNMSTIRQLCSRCIVMDQGRLIFDGDTEKAISLYCDQFSTLAVDVDLSKISHMERMLGGLTMTRLTAIDREIAVYKRNEKLLLKLQWQAHQALNDALLLFHLYTKDGQPLAWLPAKPIRSMKAGESCEGLFAIDVSSLAPGEYSLALLMADAEKGRSYPYDGIHNAFFFEIVHGDADELFSLWRRNYDGFFIEEGRVSKQQ